METAVTKSLSDEIAGQFNKADYKVAHALREQAIQQFSGLGLPGSKNEEYRFTPISAQLEKKFKWNSKAVFSSVNSVSSYLIPDLKSNLIVLVNGVFRSDLSQLDAIGSAKVATLNDALTSNTEWAEQYFTKVLPDQKDAFASLNTALWTEGIFIHVPEDETIDTPFFILQLFDGSASSVICHTRAFVLLEKNAQATIIEKSDSIGTNPSFHNFSEEIVIKEGASLEYCRIQNDNGNSHQITNTMIHQSDNSRLNTFTLTMDGQLVRNNFGITIDGEHCESHFHGLYILKGNTIADNHTVVDHKKPNSFSNEIYKGVMDGQSKGVFNGKIFVRPHAQKTNAFQSNRNILLTETAIVNTKPQLEIWADDVKCSHGCTSGQLDEEALFYLQSRGIAHDTAKAMLLYAFASEVLEPVKNETLKSYLDNLLSERLHKNF